MKLLDIIKKSTSTPFFLSNFGFLKVLKKFIGTNFVTRMRCNFIVILEVQTLCEKISENTCIRRVFVMNEIIKQYQ